MPVPTPDTACADALQLRALLAYDPSTGELTWRANGRPACFLVRGKGYLCIRVLGKKRNAHRVIWCYLHGDWPAGEIDHVNGVKDDNRADNLRDVPRSVNSQNQKRAHSRSTTGLLGVSADVSRWQFRATIFHDGKKRFLGRFPTAEAAHARYIEEKRRVHPGCTI